MHNCCLYCAWLTVVLPLPVAPMTLEVHDWSNVISKLNCGFSSRNVHIVIIDDGRLLFKPKSDLRVDMMDQESLQKISPS